MFLFVFLNIQDVANADEPLTLDEMEQAVYALADVEPDHNAPRATPVSLGAGLYMYVLDASQRFDPLVQSGHGIWEYSGQHMFDLNAKVSGEWVWAGESAPMDSAKQAEQDAHRRRIDRWGREWRLVGRTFEPRVSERTDTDSASDSASPVETERPASPSWVRFESWTHTNCDANSDIEIRRFDSDDRTTVSDIDNKREVSTVIIETISFVGFVGGLPNFEVVGLCSGSMVAENIVLTAAHCITTSSYTTEIDPAFIRVCSEGNSVDFTPTCSEVISVDANPAFLTGTHDVNEDFGILELDDPLISSGDEFVLSATDPGDWDSFDLVNHGYPGFRPACATNTVVGAVDFGVPSDLVDGTATGIGARQTAMSDAFLGLAAATVRTRLDGGGGHSGSAIFIANNGDNEIIGVWSSWGPTIDKHFGPRLEEFETFVNTAL